MCGIQQEMHRIVDNHFDDIQLNACLKDFIARKCKEKLH